MHSGLDHTVFTLQTRHTFRTASGVRDGIPCTNLVETKRTPCNILGTSDQIIDDCKLTAQQAFDCAQHHPAWRTYATALRAMH